MTLSESITYRLIPIVYEESYSRMNSVDVECAFKYLYPRIEAVVKKSTEKWNRFLVDTYILCRDAERSCKDAHPTISDTFRTIADKAQNIAFDEHVDLSV